MKITVDEVISWLIVGALAGSLAGMLVRRRKEGFGRVLNMHGSCTQRLPDLAT